MSDKTTRPYLSRFEKATLVGTRTAQLARNAPTLITYLTEPKKIALEELRLSTRKNTEEEQKLVDTERMRILQSVISDINERKKHRSIFPLMLKRPLVNNKWEIWYVEDMFDMID